MFSLGDVQARSGGTNRVGGQNFDSLVVGGDKVFSILPTLVVLVLSEVLVEYSRDSTLKSDSSFKL